MRWKEIEAPRGFWISLIGIVIVLAGIRIINITFPGDRMFDEVDQPVNAWHVLHGERYAPTHPFAAQLQVVPGLLLFGDTPMGWRFTAWLWMTFVLLGLGILGWLLFKQRTVGLLVVLLAGSDTALFLYGRTGHPDAFLLLTMIWALVCFFASTRSPSFAAALLAALLSGVLFGLAIATKWSAVLALGLVWLWEIFRRVLRVHTSFLLTPVFFLIAFALIPLATYSLVVLPLAHRFTAWEAPLGAKPFLEHCPGAPLAQKMEYRSWAERFVWWHCGLWSYHRHHRITHSGASSWWSWPLTLQPVLFYRDPPAGTVPNRHISLVGNPVIWWGGLLAIVATAIRIARKWPTRDKTLFADLWLVVGFLTLWLPWVFSPRTTFLYYYLPALLLSLLAFARWLSHLWDKPRVRFVVVLVVVLAYASFFGLLPSIMGLRR